MNFLRSRLSIMTLMAFTGGMIPMLADTITEPTAVLPPTTGQYAVADVCITGVVCLGDISLSDFQITSDMQAGPDEAVQTTAALNAEVFLNNGGVPGADRGPLSLTGTVDFDWNNRAPGELGTFSGEITAIDFAGQFNGNAFEMILNPNETSAGSATLSSDPGKGDYMVSSFFDVFTEISVNGGTFVPGPGSTATLVSATPEPASAGMALLSLLGLGGMMLRRRHSQR